MNVKEFELKHCIQFVYRPSTYFIYTFTLVFALAKTRLYYIHTCIHNELYIYASFVEIGGTAMKHSLFIFGWMFVPWSSVFAGCKTPTYLPQSLFWQNWFGWGILHNVLMTEWMWNSKLYPIFAENLWHVVTNLYAVQITARIDCCVSVCVCVCVCVWEREREGERERLYVTVWASLSGTFL